MESKQKHDQNLLLKETKTSGDAQKFKKLNEFVTRQYK